MDFFNEHHEYEKLFHLNEELNILCIGYNDFNSVKPSYVFRIQSFYTWHFIVSGSGTLEICNKKYQLKVGDMFFIPPDIKMRYYPNPNDPWKYVWFDLKGDIIKEYGSLIGFDSQTFVKENPSFQKINIILSKTLESLEKNHIGYFGTLSALYNIIDTFTINSENTGIDAIKGIIDESFTIPSFSIEKLCRDANISHAHLLRLFKNKFGITVIQYVIKKRMEFACELLKTTDLSVGEVGFSCGFTDEIYFMKSFKKATGLTALNYRKKFKK